MSDLEQQLAGVLADAAEGAPGAVGLADAARRRHRVRRRRRLAAGGVVAALVVGASATVWSGGDDRAHDPVDDPAPQGWQTIIQDDVRAEVPADWRKVTCGEGERWTPPSGDPCARWRGAAFFGSALYDAAVGPGVLTKGRDGLSGGHVYADDLVLSVGAVEYDVARRILASARVDGEPVVAAGQWVTFDRQGLVYDVPAWWGVGESGDRTAFSVCLLPPEAKGRQSYSTPSAYVVTSAPSAQGVVRVEAPTQAVAELVLAAAQVGERAETSTDCGPEDFSAGLLPPESTPGAGTPVEGGETATSGDDPTGNAPTGDAPDEDFPAIGEPGWETTLAEYEGIAAEIPTYWAENFCNDSPQWTPYEDCTRPGEGLRLYGAGYPADLGKDEGVLWSDDVEGRIYWTGYVLRGDVAVFIAHADKETARILLDRVH